VGGEAVAGDGRGGDEEDRLGAEPDVEEAGATTVAGGQRGEAAVQRASGLRRWRWPRTYGERRRDRDAPAVAIISGLARWIRGEQVDEQPCEG
jgi:hypothetical protein